MEMKQQNSGRIAQGHGICVLSIMLFAMGFPAAGVLLEDWGPISLIAVRLMISCALLLPIWLWFDGSKSVWAAPWYRGLGIGAVGFGSGAMILLVTQSMTDVVSVTLVVAMAPVAAVILEVAFDGRRFSLNFVLGLGLIVAGGLMATGANLTEGYFGLGALMGILATFIFAWGSRMTVKGLPTMSNLGKCTITLIGAMVFCLAALAMFVLLGWSGTHWSPLDGFGWSMLLIYAWCGLAVSQVFWILGVERMGIGVASFHLNATPIYVMLIVVALGGKWDWVTASGAVILIIGVMVAQQGERWAEGFAK